MVAPLLFEGGVVGVEVLVLDDGVKVKRLASEGSDQLVGVVRELEMSVRSASLDMVMSSCTYPRALARAGARV